MSNTASPCKPSFMLGSLLWVSALIAVMLVGPLFFERLGEYLTHMSIGLLTTLTGLGFLLAGKNEHPDLKKPLWIFGLIIVAIGLFMAGGTQLVEWGVFGSLTH